MSSNRWSLSRVWGGTRQNATSASGSTTRGPSSNGSRSNTTRAAPSQTVNGSQQHRRQSAPNGHPTSSSHSRRAHPAAREAEEVQYSSPTVVDSLWHAQDFMLGAGMVIIQPSTKKVVVLSEKEESAGDGRAYRYWFLPKGRKDVGESLEQTALREAYEESGLRVSFLPIVLPHNAPGAPDTLADLDRRRFLPCTEPIYIYTQAYEKRASSGRARGKAEYLTFWYVGQVPEDATVESGTRMEDEVNYETHFLSIEDALSVLHGPQQNIVNMAYRLWLSTMEMQSQSWYKQYIAELHAVAGVSTATDPSASVQAGADRSRARPESTTQAARDVDSWEESD